jgi:long-chain acyl-CoA synthetase
VLTELLYRSASSRPDAEAVVHGDERVTHAELVDRVERLAAGLAAEGVGPGDAVALMRANDPHFVTSYHAIAGLGAVVAPVNPAFKQDELEFYFRKCGVRAVITDDRGAEVCEGIVAGWDDPVPVISTEGIERLLQSEPAKLEPRAPDEPLVYLFSSGSTGRPKRVPRTHGQVCAEADFYPQIGMGPEDKIFCTVPLFHSYGMGFCTLAAAGTGATLLLLEDPNPFLLRRHRAMEMIEQERATVLPGVPFNYRLMAEAPDTADLSSLRLCFSAGTALPRSAFEAFVAKFGIPVRQHYGCTEAGSLTANLDEDAEASFETVGKPMGPVELRIVDGEVAVKSPAQTSGYSDMEELNREAFRDGFFLTGDLGQIDDEGRLTITGRKKLLIEVGGYKVDPIEVEDVVESHPLVGEAVVVGVDTEQAGEQLVKAVVVPEQEIEERELIAFCQQRLANYKVPRAVEFREEIPRSPLGKILRKYLVEPPAAS